MPRGEPRTRPRRSYLEEQYPTWVENNRPRASDLRRKRRETEGFAYKPRVSVVVPVYDPEKAWLEVTLDSVFA